jgi:hypothetical protein
MSCTQFAEVDARAKIDRGATNELRAGLKNSDDRGGSADFEFRGEYRMSMINKRNRA